MIHDSPDSVLGEIHRINTLNPWFDVDEVKKLVAKKPSKRTKKKAKRSGTGPQLVKRTGERVVANEYGQLQREREKLQAQIAEIDEKLEGHRSARQAELLAELKELGWSPSGPGSIRRAGGGGAGKRKSSSEAVCPFCQIPGHDGRAHRSQGKNKKAFSAEELRQKGLPAA